MEISKNLKQVIDSHPNMVVLIDENHKIVYRNKTTSFSGLEMQNGDVFGHWLEDEEKEKLNEKLNSVLNGGNGLNTSFLIHKDAGAFEMEATIVPVYDALDKVNQLMITLSKVKIPESSHLTELNYKRLLEAQDNAKIGSWDWTVVTNELYWTPALYEIYGVDPGKVTADNDLWTSMLHPDDAGMVNDIISAQFAKPGVFEFKHRIMRGDGKVRWLQAHGRAITNNNGEVMRMCGTGMDITHQINMEDSRKRYVTSLEEMLHMTSHKLRRPSSTWMAMMEAIEAENISKEEILDHFKVVSKIAIEMDDLTREMTDFIHSTKEKSEN